MNRRKDNFGETENYLEIDKNFIDLEALRKSIADLIKIN